MSWITTKLLGVRQLLAAASPVPQRPAMNFVSGATVVDNPVTNATDITIDASTVFTTATNLATPDTVCKRSPSGSANFAGTSHFVDVQATAGVTAATCTTSGNATVGAKLTVTGQGIIGGTLSVTGATTCTTLSVSGATTVAAIGASSITCSGTASVTGTLSCGVLLPTSIHTSADVEVGSNLVVDNACTIIGALTAGTITSGSNVTCAIGSSFKLGSTRTYTRTASAAPIVEAGKWTVTGLPSNVVFTSVGTAGTIAIPLAVPDGATLTSVSVFVKSVASHALIPANKRTVSLLSYYTSSNIPATQWVTPDPLSVVASYDASHAITATGSLVIDRSGMSMYVLLTDESSTNSIAGNTNYYSASYTYTMDKVVDT